MKFEIAKLRAAVGFVLTRDGGPVFTGAGLDADGDSLGLIDMRTREQFEPSLEDEAATDWREV